MRRTLVCVAVAAIAAILPWCPSAAGEPDKAFMTQIGVAMTKMMTAMQRLPSGNVDRDFVATMVPHHQGAIAMAEAELRYGRNEQLRRIAQEIIVTQQEEVLVMRLAVIPPVTSARPTSNRLRAR